MDIRSIIAIDAHSHFNHGVRHDTKESSLSIPTREHLRKKYDMANVGCMVCSTFSSVLSVDDVYEENEYLEKVSNETDWIYQYAVIDPRNDKTFEQADRLLKTDKCLGVKIHPYFHNFTLEEYGDKLFSFIAERNAVIQMHPEEKVDSVIPFANKYKDAKIILAHLGFVEHVDAMEYAIHKNVYTDTSGGLSNQNNIVEYAVGRVGADRILFGTDTYDTGFQRGRIEYALISDEDKVKILRDNAIKLFNGKIKL